MSHSPTQAESKQMPQIRMATMHRIAYVSRLVIPKPAAHVLQTVKMAAALADCSGDAHLFVRELVTSEAQLRRQYAIDDSALRIWSMHADRVPARLHRYYRHPVGHNSLVAGLLGIHPAWWRRGERRKVLFTRFWREMLYWGLARRYLWWMKNWVFVYEAHDVAGLEPSASLEENPFDKRQDRERFLRALCSFDLVLCVTQALADDLMQWSGGRLHPHVVRHASSLPRLSQPPVPRFSADRVVVGYVGTIDTYRGVDKLLEAMRLLPEYCHLRLVGRVRDRSDNGAEPAWLAESVHDPGIGDRIELLPWVPVHQVADEIDRCDIVVQPASDHILTLRYASPIKSFDYMVRGKPIVAADVPCHRELLQDGVNACLYRHDDAADLAATLRSLLENPQRAQEIGQSAWEGSADYTYEARARRILDLVDQVWERRRAA